jgi:hypothetical protein
MLRVDHSCGLHLNESVGVKAWVLSHGLLRLLGLVDSVLCSGLLSLQERVVGSEALISGQ